MILTKRVPFFISLFYLFIVSACNQPNDDHRLIKKYAANKLEKEYFVDKENKKDGVFKEYYPNGKAKLIFNYVKDSLEGEQKSFYETGSLQTIGYYFNNQLDSIQKWYYPKDIIKSESFRLEGQLFGVQKEYHPDGKLKDLYFMRDDSDMTSSLDIDENGKIIKNTGNIVYCVFEKNILNTKDTSRVIFYIYHPPSYQFECQLVEKKEGGYTKREKCELIKINNNKGVLVQRNFKEPGNYEIGLSILLSNKSLESTLADSMFLKVKVN